MMELIKNLPDYILTQIAKGDFEDNSSINECCAKRLLFLCDDYEEEAKQLLQIVLHKIEIYI